MQENQKREQDELLLKEAALNSEVKQLEEKVLLRKKKEEEDQENYHRVPIKGSVLYEKNRNKLDIYLYPQYQVSDLSDIEKQNLKVIVIVGVFGCGKSTLLDAMVNYLADVEFTDNFRYKLKDEKQILKNNYMQTSLTGEEVNSYFIKPQGNKRMNLPILFVDTPGFLNTKRLGREKEITENIAEFFKTNKIDRIHCVCLVSDSQDVRLICSQKYVFDKVLEIFGKGIEDNIANMFTFCDEGPVKSLKKLQNENIPLKFSYKFNNAALFLQTGKDIFENLYWNMGIQSMNQFFNDVLGQFIPKKLSLNQEDLNEKIE